MVKTVEKAKRIQEKRSANGKRGLAQSVKRFLKREGKDARALQ